MQATLMTVGQLAKRVGMRPSALRFYEGQGLLLPSAHSEGGYRLYSAADEETLRFIVRAQRLGFSLADIRTLLEAWHQGVAADETLVQIAQARYIALERQLTPLLVSRHELAHLLQDLRGTPDANDRPRLTNLLDEVCADPLHQPAETTLERLLNLTGCQLTSEDGQDVLDRLRGQHVHVWQEGEAYHMLVVSDNPAVGIALDQLAFMESGCTAHGDAHHRREVRRTDEGYVLVAEGDDSFLYARLFMALEGDL